MPEDRRDETVLRSVECSSLQSPQAINLFRKVVLQLLNRLQRLFTLHTSSEMKSVLLNSSGTYQIRLPAQDYPSSCGVRNCDKVPKYSLFMFRGVRKIAKKRLLASSYLSVCLSARTEQLSSHWAGFHEIWFFENFSNIYKCPSSFKI